MKRLLYWLYLLVKRQLKNPVIVVVLIAMPVAALIITHTASLKEAGAVRVGIVLEDDDKIAIMTRDYLMNGDYSVQFYEAESQEKLEQLLLRIQRTLRSVCNLHLRSVMHERYHDG